MTTSKRVLDFDTENVPGFYWYDEKSTDILHTAAWSWIDDDLIFAETTEWAGDDGLVFPAAGFERFITAIESTDVVTGHNIVRHDVPLLNAHAARVGRPPIKWPELIDTMRAYPRVKGMPRNQEYLGMMNHLETRKTQVGLYVWERAARGEAAASEIVVARCIDDVVMHKELYKALYLKEAHREQDQL